MIIIDNGHGRNTPGKRSPNQKLVEWAYNRWIARELARVLKERGIECCLLVPEVEDVPLRERAQRADNISRKRRGCVLVSIHLNAAGNGGWHDARGFSAFVCPGARAPSRALARQFTMQAAKMGLAGNRATPPPGYWEANLYMCRCVDCPAVLTENLFMDNREDADFLLAPGTPAVLARMHADAIVKWLEEEGARA